MALYGQVSFTTAMVIEGGSGVTQSFRASVISLPYGYYFIPLSSITLVCQQCTHKACRLCLAACCCWWCRNRVYRFHGQLMARYKNHRLSSRGLLFVILVHNKAAGQTDCWTRECLNKSSRWASLLWVSLVSHLFIAPLSLISSHCLLCWHKPLCSVRPRWCLIQLPQRLPCCLCTSVVAEQHTCPPLCPRCAEMSFETAKIYGQRSKHPKANVLS